MNPSALRQSADAMHELWGGKICLDFANTVEPRGGPPPIAVPAGVRVRDEVETYADLVAWSVHAETLAEADGNELLSRAAHRPSQANEVLDRALTLREAIYRVFWSIANGDGPGENDLGVLQREHADMAPWAVIVPVGAGYAWSWATTDVPLTRPLWPITRSATDLLTGDDVDRVNVCPGGADSPFPCAWLFYDATKNRSRRWCSMSDCGGATKARRQTDRRRAARQRTGGTNQD